MLRAAAGAVLAAVERDLLRVEVLKTALARALDLTRSNVETLESQSRPIREELGRLDAEVARLAGAIAAGGELSALLSALRERERRRDHLRAELATLERATKSTGGLDVHRVLDELREQLTDWQGLLRQEAPQARQALSALLAGRLIFTPEGGRPGTLLRIRRARDPVIDPRAVWRGLRAEGIRHVVTREPDAAPTVVAWLARCGGRVVYRNPAARFTPRRARAGGPAAAGTARHRLLTHGRSRHPPQAPSVPVCPPVTAGEGISTQPVWEVGSAGA